MNIGGLGSVGNLAGLVGSVVGLGIVAIVLLTFAPHDRWRHQPNRYAGHRRRQAVRTASASTGC